MSTTRPSGLSNKVTIFTDAALRYLNKSTKYANVRPLSMISSTIKICLPSTFVSKSLTIFTSPEETVALP